jgi:hypothetical protein
MSAKQQELDVALTEEDLEVLRDMAEMVRAAKTLLSGLARLISGGSR